MESVREYATHPNGYKGHLPSDDVGAAAPKCRARSLSLASSDATARPYLCSSAAPIQAASEKVGAGEGRTGGGRWGMACRERGKERRYMG